VCAKFPEMTRGDASRDAASPQANSVALARVHNGRQAFEVFVVNWAWLPLSEGSVQPLDRTSNQPDDLSISICHHRRELHLEPLVWISL
jgi:hypothetical protein